MIYTDLIILYTKDAMRTALDYISLNVRNWSVCSKAIMKSSNYYGNLNLNEINSSSIHIVNLTLVLEE